MKDDNKTSSTLTAFRTLSRRYLGKRNTNVRDHSSLNTRWLLMQKVLQLSLLLWNSSLKIIKSKKHLKDEARKTLETKHTLAQEPIEPATYHELLQITSTLKNIKALGID